MALAAVYHSLGRDANAAEIWLRLSDDLTTDGATPTHRLAADAIEQGLSAACLRAAEPGFAPIAVALRGRWRVVLNLRDESDPAAGHFVLARRVLPAALVIDDPSSGTTRRLDSAELARRWAPRKGAEEVSGAVLVAIGPGHATDRRDRADCPCCNGDYPLPGVLGLGWRRPWASCWSAAHCPWCDALATPDRVEATAL